MLTDMLPLSYRERGWGEGTNGARYQHLRKTSMTRFVRTLIRPSGTFSRREREHQGEGIARYGANNSGSSNNPAGNK
ncbi:hypothetical protein GCM10007901_35540 [Dyella acidisoli]|uniref:Uncharacterized protein n=1 Tax=Dyella acidisoli TaxID=1867834 RepID=A0ABQ5XTC5_9GAMM|nr:hypothetical protein GCM10007901_35540 [Dyella acidisoli]